MAEKDKEKKVKPIRKEVREGDVLLYARPNSGMTTAEGFRMEPGKPITAGPTNEHHVTVGFGQRLVDEGYYVITEPKSNKDDEDVDPVAQAQAEMAETNRDLGAPAPTIVVEATSSQGVLDQSKKDQNQPLFGTSDQMFNETPEPSESAKEEEK